MYAVSSGFSSAAASKNAPWQRRFTIGTSDYSDYVSKWPSISKQWDQLNPQTVSIDLSNEGQTFNFLTADPTKMRSESAVKLGFVYAVGSEEFVTMFSGTVDSARFQGGKCSVTLIDKFRKLTDRKIGDNTSAVNYISSSYLVHDMAWYLCSSLGGLSGVKTTGNIDIDYTSWSSWSSVFSVDNVRVKAQFTGQTPLEALRKLSTLTDSAIYIENNKIKFMRFSLVDSNSATLDDGTIIDATATLDDRSLVNAAYISAGYDTTSKSFGITVSDMNSGSQASYGVREQVTAEQVVWLVDSVSALNLAQRRVARMKDLRPMLSVKTPLQAAVVTIGDTVAFTDALLGIDNSFRIMSETVDFDSGIKTFGIDKTQYFSAFYLDGSQLDGLDVLT